MRVTRSKVESLLADAQIDRQRSRSKLDAIDPSKSIHKWIAATERARFDEAITEAMYGLLALINRRDAAIREQERAK
jgi:hypothetical protein